MAHSSQPYDQSTRAVFDRLGLGLHELEDWNCCGATVYMSVKETVSFAISARNLALAEPLGRDIVAPCSACYLVLNKTNRFLRELPELNANVNDALSAAGLKYDGTVRVRHPLEVLVNDVGIDEIARRASRRLDGLRIAEYYGCQIIRPERTFDDQEFPMTMDRLFAALGAQNVYFPMKVRCCGGMLMTTANDVAEKLCGDLIECALFNGADCLVTTCPLCQMNLAGYQGSLSKRFGKDLHIPVLWFTELLGLALGIDAQTLGHGSHLESVERVTSRVGA
jgi:heterodisulfide reductase subunit B